MSKWKAGCGESRTSGLGGGMVETYCCKAIRRSIPTSPKPRPYMEPAYQAGKELAPGIIRREVEAVMQQLKL